MSLSSWKGIGSAIKAATVENINEAKKATTGAIDGVRASFNGAKVITEGTKEVHLPVKQLEDLLNNTVTEIVLDDTATDDGYNKVRVTLVAGEV